MTHTTPADARSLDSRYGRTPRRLGRRALVVLLSSLVVLAVAGVAWVAWLGTDEPSDPEIVGYAVMDRYRAEVTAVYTPDAERAQRCGVEVRNREQAVVGYSEVDIPADPERTPARLTTSLRTTQEASAGTVTGCWFL